MKPPAAVRSGMCKFIIYALLSAGVLHAYNRECPAAPAPSLDRA
jgi:hypothetical protein